MNMKPKFIKIFLAIEFMLMLSGMFITTVSAAANGGPNIAANTGDSGIIGIIIAVAAFIATAFITTKLTKRKNK